MRRVCGVMFPRTSSALKANSFSSLQMNGDGLCPAIVDDRFVDREARIGVHDLRAGFTVHHDGEEHRDLAARDDNDTVRVDLNAVAFV